tara:strand:- start:5073 stop:5591 length:519 start_codon:yes stop_codon:yes gene_type:complete
MEEPNFDSHIPGQSLTKELGQYPWQRPPQYNTVDDAMEFYAKRIMNPVFRDQIAETMELGVPLTSIANALQGNGVMMGKHTIDVGVLILPVIMEMLAYVGDEEGVDYVMGTELEEPDDDKFKDSTIAVAMKKVKSKMEAAGDAPVEDTEPMMKEETAEASEPPATGLMARRV